MPHRDPETGKFVSDDHGGALAAADDVLIMRAAPSVGNDTDSEYSAGDTVNNLRNLDLQRDYRLLAIDVMVETYPQSADSGADPSPSAAFSQVEVDIMLGTTGSYQTPTQPENGGTEPPGVYWRHHMNSSAGQVWEDETNGTGGFIPGVTESIHRRIPAEEIVNADVSLDAGTSINLHLDVRQDGSTSTDVLHELEFRFYVAKREDN